MSLYCDLCFPKQTFSLTEKISKPWSARLFSRAFFCLASAPGGLLLVPTAPASARQRRILRLCRRWRMRPVFHHIVTRVERRGEKVLPVIAMPGRVEFYSARCVACRFSKRAGFVARAPEPAREMPDAIQPHGPLPIIDLGQHCISAGLPQLGKLPSHCRIDVAPVGFPSLRILTSRPR